MRMTREEAKEMLPIIQAWADGKTVDWYDPEIGWRLSGFTLDFDKNPKYFRINSKAEPKYRPFKTRDECWEEMHKHPDFGWVKVNVTGEYEQIVRIFDYCKTELSFNIANSDDDYSSEMILNNYTFTDGAPFGVKDE